MSHESHALRAVNGVAWRIRAARWGRSAHAAALVGAGLAALLLLIGRLTAWYPVPGLERLAFWEAALGIAVVCPAAGALAASLWPRRVTRIEAARRIDAAAGLKDLFLTRVLTPGGSGSAAGAAGGDAVGTFAFAPLVVRDADQHAQLLQPAQVVPWRWQRRTAVLAVVLAGLGGLAPLLPQCDPFQTAAAAEEIRERQLEMQKVRKATLARLAELKKDDAQGENVREVDAAVAKLQQSLRTMKPTEQVANRSELLKQQKALGQLLGKIDARSLSKFLADAQLDGQMLGGRAGEKMAKWSHDLQKGSMEGLKRELKEIAEKIERLQKSNDPVEKAALQQEIKKQLRDVADFARSKSGANSSSKKLSQALKQALEQLEAARSPHEQLAAEAREAVQASMEMARMELDTLAQSVEDLKKLEEALALIQQARQVNEKGELDGEQIPSDILTLADYAEFYRELMAGMEGEGAGDPGGGGGKVDEDESTQTDFVPEEVKSQLQAGKLILSMKTRGDSEAGEAKVDYKRLVQDVKQGYAEAIEAEQVPPGYYEGIQGYFDNLEKLDPAPKK